MTTEKDSGVTPSYDPQINNCPIPKRFGLGNKYYNGLSVPEIIEKPDGEYVRFDDYDLALKHNAYLEAMFNYYKRLPQRHDQNTEVVASNLEHRAWGFRP